MTVLRLYPTSAGLDPAGLRPGHDLVLDMDEQHGFDLPVGAAAGDLLDIRTRREIDTESRALLTSWRSACEPALTFADIALPWIWEIDLLADIVLPALRHARAVVRAVEQFRPTTIEVVSDDPWLLELVAAAAGPVDVSRATSLVRSPRPQPLLRARGHPRRLVAGVEAFGIPSRPRRGSTLILPYWSVLPLVDRMLEVRARPAVWLARRPFGTRRLLRMLSRGGWAGTPGPRARRAADAALARLAAVTEPPELAVFGVSLGPYLHARLMDFIRVHAPATFADGLFWRRLFSRGRIARVVVPYDHVPEARLLVAMARAAGVRTLLAAHGVFFGPAVAPEGEVADELALWSAASAPPVEASGRTILHIVGYPGERSPPRRLHRTGRIVVLGQATERLTSMYDHRMVTRHYATAVRAAARATPAATVILRPHPAHPLAPLDVVRARHPEMRVEVDARTPILDLFAGCDVCVGCPSTATLQTALVGTPLVVLNVSGFEWPWPLGGETSVPLAHDEHELAEHLGALWSLPVGVAAPGHADLLAGLGADAEGDPTQRLLEIVVRDERVPRGSGGPRRPAGAVS